MKEGVNLVNPKNGLILYTNRRFERMFGYNKGELINKPVSILNAKGEKSPDEVVKETIRSLKRSGVWKGEIYNKKKNGTYFWSRAVVSAFIHPEQGKVWISVQEDITEKKKADEEIKLLLEKESRSAREWQETFDSAKDIITLLSPDFEFLKVNRAGCKALNKKVKDLLGKKCYKVIHGLDRPIEGCPCKKAIKTGKEGASEILEHGWNYLVTASPVFDKKGKIKSFVHTVRDITERKKAEEKLRLDNEIMTNMSEGVYLVRAKDGIIVYANPKFEKMFGYTSEEMIGKHVSIVNAPLDKDPKERAKEIMADIFKNGEWHGEVNNIKKDGTPFWCYANVSMFDHPVYGRVLVAVHSDITHSKKLQQQLIHSEKMSAVGQLAAGVAHEFKNLLAIIKGNIQLSMMESSMDEIRAVVIQKIAEVMDDFIGPIRTKHRERIARFINEENPEYRTVLKYNSEAIDQI